MASEEYNPAPPVLSPFQPEYVPVSVVPTPPSIPPPSLPPPIGDPAALQGMREFSLTVTSARPSINLRRVRYSAYLLWSEDDRLDPTVPEGDPDTLETLTTLRKVRWATGFDPNVNGAIPPNGDFVTVIAKLEPQTTGLPGMPPVRLKRHDIILIMATVEAPGRRFHQAACSVKLVPRE
jgi:hypothetical protein